jgi:hypothetical protein
MSRRPQLGLPGASRAWTLPLLFSLASLAAWPLAGAASAQQAQAPQSAKTWLAARADFEAFLRTAEVKGTQAIPVGVTKPLRCQLAAGGPFAEMAWKAIRPGRYEGYLESYTHDIAAYELDKLLGLDMIPPTVEKRVRNEPGAAVMWVSPTQSFKQLGGAPTPPAAEAARWSRQLSRAKMFDNLIANIDPNLGNWLVDPAWNLILIDHTRAFITDKRLVHKMQRIDAELWNRIEALTEESLQAAIGQWIGKSGIRAILQRREEMRKAIARMVTDSGEDAVFIK